MLTQLGYSKSGATSSPDSVSIKYSGKQKKKLTIQSSTVRTTSGRRSFPLLSRISVYVCRVFYVLSLSVMVSLFQFVCPTYSLFRVRSVSLLNREPYTLSDVETSHHVTIIVEATMICDEKNA